MLHVQILSNFELLEYRNYLNERRGTHLIFYLSNEALIRGGGAHLSSGAH